MCRALAAAVAAGLLVSASALASAPVVRSLDPAKGRYQLVVDPAPVTASFRWAPPRSLRITSVTSSENGRCALAARAIVCTRVAHRRGRPLLVSFVARGSDAAAVHAGPGVPPTG